MRTHHRTHASCLALLFAAAALATGCATPQAERKQDAGDALEVERERQMLQTADPERIIESHSDNIARLRVELGLDSASNEAVTKKDGAGATFEDDSTDLRPDDLRNAPPEPGSCELTCGLAQDMCVSSETICTVADGYRDDPRYRDTCTWARDSCDDALAQCEACTTPVVKDAR